MSSPGNAPHQSGPLRRIKSLADIAAPSDNDVYHKQRYTASSSNLLYPSQNAPSSSKHLRDASAPDTVKSADLRKRKTTGFLASLFGSNSKTKESLQPNDGNDKSTRRMSSFSSLFKPAPKSSEHPSPRPQLSLSISESPKLPSLDGSVARFDGFLEDARTNSPEPFDNSGYALKEAKHLRRRSQTVSTLSRPSTPSISYGIDYPPSPLRRSIMIRRSNSTSSQSPNSSPNTPSIRAPAVKLTKPTPMSQRNPSSAILTPPASPRTTLSSSPRSSGRFLSGIGLALRRNNRSVDEFGAQAPPSGETIDDDRTSPSTSPDRARSKRKNTASSASRLSAFFGLSTTSTDDLTRNLTPSPSPLLNGFTTSPQTSPTLKLGNASSSSLLGSPSYFDRRLTLSTPPLSRDNSVSFSHSPSTPGALGRLSLDTRKSLSPADLVIENDETPESYVTKLAESVSKTEIPAFLASSGDEFHTAALEWYLASFDFHQDPIDVALRRLLLNLKLPKETQQIDRVMEAFAKRYNRSNPNLFASSDTPYILAFSLIMLHTDAFNKSNKMKMSKQAYVKNASVDGVPQSVLEYLYDNICFAPFVYLEDDFDINGQRNVFTEPLSTSIRTLSSPSKAKLDPYPLIIRREISKLRVPCDRFVSWKNPFSFTGTVAFFSSTELHRAVLHGPILNIPLPRKRSSTDSEIRHLTRARRSSSFISSQPQITLRISKYGRLSRKEDVGENGKKSSGRKWQEWFVILTGSQLVMFKDMSLASMIEQNIHYENEATPTQFLPTFRPDSVFSLKDCIGLYDSTYTRYDYVFRLVLPTGRELLLQANNDIELNSWLASINYAASFKTAGIRMRSLPPDTPASPPLASTLGSPKRFTSLFEPIEYHTLPKRLGNLPSPPSPTAILGFPDPDFPPESPMPEQGRNFASRSDVIRAKLEEFDQLISSAKIKLEHELLTARNLAILTPWQTSTRTRLESSVRSVGARIRKLHIEMARSICARQCLARDLVAEEREQSHVRQRTISEAFSIGRQSLDKKVDRKQSKMSMATTVSDSDEDRYVLALEAPMMESSYSLNEIEVASKLASPPMRRAHTSSEVPPFKPLPQPPIIIVNEGLPSPPEAHLGSVL